MKNTRTGPLATSTSDTSIAALMSSVLLLKNRIEEIHNSTQGEFQRTRSELSQRISRVQANVSRIALQPAVRSVIRTQDATTMQQPGLTRRNLLGTPKHLYDLWKEYEFGLCGNKPAKSFTSSERGQCRSAFSRRKIFWDVIANLVRKGYTSDVAIDKTYIVYGRCNSVNTILLRMRDDRRTGGHPDLR